MNGLLPKNRGSGNLGQDQTLQYACEIDPKFNTRWSNELAINTYADAELYLVLIQPSEEEHAQSRDEVVRKQTIELKNAKFIITEIQAQISKDERENLTSLFNQCCESYVSSCDLSDAVTARCLSSYRF